MRALFLLAAVAAFGMAVILLAAAQNPALAQEPDRAIPTMEVSSPASGEISVTWSEPSDTETLTSYRVSWAPWEKDGFTSYKDDNSDTGGNAYPGAPASSYKITGLAEGEYAVYLRARYEDFENGPFLKSSKVAVGGNTAGTTPSRRIRQPRPQSQRRRRNPRRNPRRNRHLSRSRRQRLQQPRARATAPSPASP